MSRKQSDGEGSVGETGTDRFVDATVETEVELRLPLEAYTEPDAQGWPDLSGGGRSG